MRHLNSTLLALATATAPTHAAWVKTSGPDSVRVFSYGSANLQGGGIATALLAGTGHGIFRSSDDGATWSAINGDLPNTAIRTLAIFRDTLYAGTEEGGVFRSGNGGANWTPLNTGLTNLNVRSMRIYGTDFYVGTTGGGVFRSTNRGASWSTIGIGATSATINTLEFYSNALYAGTEGDGVFTAPVGSTTWSATNPNLTNLNIRSLLWDASYLFAGVGDGVYALRMNWFPDPGWKKESLGATTSPTIRALAIPGAYTDGFVPKLAGTQENGVFLLNQGSASWQPINDGLTEMDIRAVWFTYSYLYVGANGGVWRRQASEVVTAIQPPVPKALEDFRIHGGHTLSFTFSSPARVTLTAHTPSGRLAATLLDEPLPAGAHTRRIDASVLPRGLYLYRLRAGDLTESRTVVLTR